MPERTKSRIVAGIALSLFSLACMVLIAFGLQRLNELPSPGDTYAGIKYSVFLILDLGAICAFSLLIIRVSRGGARSETDRETTDATTARWILAALIGSAVVAAAIIVPVLFTVMEIAIAGLGRDPRSVPHWILVLFFPTLSALFVIFFGLAIGRTSRSKRALARGETDVATGLVIEKRVIAVTGSMTGRGASRFVYALTLEGGRTYYNVEKAHFDRVEVGQRIEIRALPYMGEVVGLRVLDSAD